MDLFSPTLPAAGLRPASGDVVPATETDAALDWYCVHTRSKREHAVADFLQATLRAEVYFPRLQQYRTIRRVRKLMVSPIFPRYLFCRCSAPSLRTIRFATDVVDLVHAGSQPVRVPDEIVSELRSWAGDILDLSGHHVSPDSAPALPPTSPLASLLLQSADDRDRIAVLLALVAGDARLTASLPAAAVPAHSV